MRAVTDHDGDERPGRQSVRAIGNSRRRIARREQKVKIQYVQKLRRVLIAAANESPIRSLAQALQTGALASLYYYHQGRFRVAEAITRADSSAVVTLQTNVAGHKLSLDCSLRFFQRRE